MEYIPLCLRKVKKTVYNAVEHNYLLLKNINNFTNTQEFYKRQLLYDQDFTVSYSKIFVNLWDPTVWTHMMSKLISTSLCLIFKILC
jgi:hypothetical protein